jgi:ATP adenylyltransferase
MTMLRRGTLWNKVVERTERALASGALHPIATDCEFVEDAGMRFFVRVLANIERKEKAMGEQKKKAELSGKEANPFLNFEKDLFVTDISDTHVALLNKFNVVDHHLLIVTREYEDQETLLTLRDFEALSDCLGEYNGLCFYNGGQIAGASQPHKHLQMVPLPLAPEGPDVPIDPLLPGDGQAGDIVSVKGLPFLHAFTVIQEEKPRSRTDPAEMMFESYAGLLRKTGMDAPEASMLKRQSGPYCLLVTRSWMLLVPRSVEFFDSVSINSLGFAGALLVRNREQLKTLRDFGPMNALKSVAFAA